MRFSLQQPYGGRETFAIAGSARAAGVEYEYTRTALPGTIPVGTVEFCAPLMGREPIIKDFYPQFLRGYVSRRVQLMHIACGSPYGVFVKSATQWKSSFQSRVLNAGGAILPGHWYVSQVVEFINEWRYYVACGDVVTAAWYAGQDEGSPAPPVAVDWPRSFSGAVDFGMTSEGRIELVEAHAPYGCGWYGDSSDNELFTIWQALAWGERSFWLAL